LGVAKRDISTPVLISAKGISVICLFRCCVQVEKTKSMNKILIALLTIISFNCQGQETEKFNLGFENQKEEKSLSDGWL
jgi:hypothetical protein